ncbi:MAG: ATP synthase F1 subunit gamma [Candidatus Delongbacteria bacterium]
MASLKQIKRRIGSVSSTQQITKAMKMIAAARLRKAQEAIVLARPYALRLQEALAGLAASQSSLAHPLLARPLAGAAPRVCYLVVTADRGLCGGFNANVIKRTQQLLAEAPAGQESKLFLVGKKGVDFYRSRTIPVVGRRAGIFNRMNFSDATSIGLELTQLFERGEVDRVVLVFNEFKSAIQQILHTDQLLPVVLEEGGPAHAPEAIFEPGPQEVLSQLLPMYVNRIVWRVLLDSFAAEQGARMTAMESATENASEMIADLTLQYNRQRQAAITQEIAEIVGGAAAIQ